MMGLRSLGCPRQWALLLLFVSYTYAWYLPGMLSLRGAFQLLTCLVSVPRLLDQAVQR
jgi:hypothetical protein